MTRNVVLVTIDSLRADHCGFLGGEHETTPTLDRLANDGVVYEDAIAPGPRTPSSLPVLFTGEFVRPPDDRDWTWRYRRQRLREHLGRHRTLTERLRDRGYATAGLTANPWTQATGFEAGFDRFVNLGAEEDVSDGPLGFRLLDRLMDVGGLGQRYNWANKREWFRQWPQHYDAVVETVEQLPEPYFLWVFLLDPHQPYLAPRAYRTESTGPGMYYAGYRAFRNGGPPSGDADARLRRAYRDAVRSSDAFVGRLRSDLDDSDPVLVVHSDHGEAFGEHGTYGHEPALFEENLSVPLLVSGLDAAERVTDPVTLRQLPPMLEALAAEDQFQPGEFTSNVVYAATEDGSGLAVRGRRWKYVVDRERESLYDLREDPTESTDLALDESGTADELARLAERWRRHQFERTGISTAAEALAQAP